MRKLILAIVISLAVGAGVRAQQAPALSTAAAPAACECSRCIAVYGDSRSHHEIHAKLAALIQARRPQAVFHTGDMVGSGSSKKDWEKFREITRALREGSSFYAVMGNHEEGGEKTFRELFRFPGKDSWKSVSLRGVRFILLDYTSPLGKNSEQLKWLEAELAFTANAARFTAIVMHKSLFSSGRHWDETWRPAKDLEPLFKKYKAALVLAGHDHDYERLEKDGLTYIVTGGGGAELRPLGAKNPYSRFFAETNNYTMLSVCGAKLKGEAFDLSDKLLDSFEVVAGPAEKAGTDEAAGK